MSEGAIVGIVSFCFVLTGLFLANMFLMMMIGEVNRKREEGNLISYFGFTFPKMLRIFGEYRRSYPSGKLHVYALGAFALAMLSLIAVAVCLRILA
jgi:tellurite resistance protein TehA-like permease